MPFARLAIAACVLLVLAGCGVGHSSEAEPPQQQATPTAAAERSDFPAPDGVRTSIGNDVVLTASAPKSFTPTDTAYPRVPRAIAIDLTVDNGGSIPFRPAQLLFVATVDGVAAEQVIDSTQGYTGVSGATDEIAPSASLNFAVAFGMPDKTCSVQVEVRPDTPGAAAIELYDGDA